MHKYRGNCKAHQNMLRFPHITYETTLSRCMRPVFANIAVCMCKYFFLFFYIYDNIVDIAMCSTCRFHLNRQHNVVLFLYLAFKHHHHQHSSASVCFRLSFPHTPDWLRWCFLWLHSHFVDRFYLFFFFLSYCSCLFDQFIEFCSS